MLCKKTGLRQATISDIESGLTDSKLSTLTAIAAALGCNIADLFELDRTGQQKEREASRSPFPHSILQMRVFLSFTLQR